MGVRLGVSGNSEGCLRVETILCVCVVFPVYLRD